MVFLFFCIVLPLFVKKNNIFIFVLTFIIGFIVCLGMTSLTYAEDPLSLKECINIALRENQEFKNAGRRTDIAKVKKTEAVSMYLPDINAVMSSSQTRVGPTINNRVVYQGIELSEGANYQSPSFVTNSHYTGGTISQLLFDGASINRIKQENARVSSALASKWNTRSQVILECKRRFYALRQSEEQKWVGEKLLEVAEQQLIHTQLLVDGRVVPRLDVYQTRVARNNAKILLLQAQLKVENARAGLNNYLGRLPDTPISIAPDEETIHPLQYTHEHVVKTALENNSYIRSLEQEVKANQYSIAISRSRFLPTINFTGSYYRYNSTFSKVYAQLDKNYSIYYGLTLSYNLFKGFRQQSDIQKAQIQLSISEENLDSAKREISASVASAVRKHSMLLEMLALQKDSIFKASEAVRVAKEQYHNGEGTLLDVLDVKGNLISTKFQRIEIQFEAIIAKAELEALSGIEEE